MKRFFLPLIVCAAFTGLRAEVAVYRGQPTVGGREYLIAGWNFNADSGDAENRLAVSHGSGLLTTNWEAESTTDFAGTTGNAFGSDAAGRDLGLRNGPDLLNEGRYLEFSFSLADFGGLEASYATRRSETGFKEQTWSWSLDGETFVPFATVEAGSSHAVRRIDFAEVAALDGVARVVLRLTLSGLPESPSSLGNNRFDNVQFRATAIRGSAGPGTASLSNRTDGSELWNTVVFEPGGEASIAISLAGTEAAVIESARIGLPEAWSGAGIEDVVLSGPGLSGASVAIEDRAVRISGAAIGASEATLVLNGVRMPSAAEASGSGSFSLRVETARAGEPLALIGKAPAGLLAMPIANVRAVDEAGNAELLTRRVAVSGVATVDPGLFHNERFVVYLQDGTGGVAVYHPSLEEMSVGSTEGKRYVAIGEVIQFNGLTQIALGGEEDFVRIGSAAVPEPRVYTLEEVRADPERLEGRLIRISRVSKAEGGGDWPEPGATGSLRVADEDGRFWIEVLMHRFTNISWMSEPAYPVDLVGVLSQSDDEPPWTGGYRFLPRSGRDILPASEPERGFEAWRAKHFAGHLEKPEASAAGVDPDGDGLPNLLEYALGGDPHTGSSALLPKAESEEGRLAIRFRRLKAVGDVVYSVEASSDLAEWTEIWNGDDFPHPVGEEVREERVPDLESAEGEPRRFLRLRVTRRPVVEP